GDERRLLAERLAGWQQEDPDVPVERVLTRDRPVRSLLQVAQTAQLVVGSRGRCGFAGMLLGSTSHALIHHCPCPLVVVPDAPNPEAPSGSGRRCSVNGWSELSRGSGAGR
ncbi:MAG TPA: universal stress protein, partial [Pseudonocardiaceae bacterium]